MKAYGRVVIYEPLLKKISLHRKRRIGLVTGVLFFFISFCTVHAIRAADGELDRTFGDRGKAVIQIAPDERDFAKAVAVQMDGKIIIGGELGDFGADFNRSVLIRLNADGSPDTSFGTNGRVINPGQRHLPALVLQPDGKIVTAASTGMVEINHIFAVARYNANGSLDTSFGSGGYAINGLGTAESVFLQPDGKIVLVGFVKVFRNGSDFVVARFNADGSPDQTFGTGGRVQTSFTTGLNSGDTGRWGALQADGKIVVCGSITGVSMVLIRYNSDGSVDTSFGLEGSVLNSTFGATANRVLIQPDGKIVVGGGAFVLGRFLSDGHFDQSFGTGGKISGGFGTGNGHLYGLAIQSDLKVLAAGSVCYSGTGDCVFAVSRHNTNGGFDESFGTHGFTLTNFTGALDEAFGMTLQPDGKAILAGYAAEPGASYVDFAAARYTSSAPVAGRRTQFDFDGDGKADIGIFRPGPAEWWYSRSSDGQARAAQFGVSTDKIVPGDFTGDGKADIALWRPSTGTWFILRSEDGSYFAFPFGSQGDIPVPADYDGDSKVDAAVFRPSTNVWYILPSGGGSAAYQFGAAGDLPVVSDYDGDAKADIAIFRPSRGEWWIQRTTAGTLAVQFGTSTDKNVPGDFTGDGKSDVALFRPSTGTWFILRSEDFSYYSRPFGSSGDVVAPGDFDGDGKFDVSVFRPSSNTWYIDRTSAGILITQFGLTGDQPIPNAFVP